VTPVWLIHGVVHHGDAAPAEAPEHAVIASGPFRALASPATLGLDAASDAAAAVRHDAILTAWAQIGDVAPARFGAAAATRDRVAALIAANAEAHAAALARVRGAVEYGLRVTAEGPPPAPSGPEGLSYLRARAAARDAVRDAVAARAATARALVGALSGFAREHVAFKPRAAADGSARLADLALLVPRERAAALVDAAAALGAQATAAGLSLRLSGPLAPYAFAMPAPEAAA
jgi:hypothetical protein